MTALAALLRPQARYAVGKPARVAQTWCGLWAAGAVVLAVLGAWQEAAACVALCVSLTRVGQAADRWAVQLADGGEDACGDWINPGLDARYGMGREFLADFRWDQFIADGRLGFTPDWAAWAACLADALGDLLDGVDKAGFLTPAAQS